MVQLRPHEREELLWAGAPVVRARAILAVLVLWALFLVVPVCLLVELIEETGGWWALAWAVVSVFVFVPRVSQGSRVVFALTSVRAFVSVRTMHCSIETRAVGYGEMASVRADKRPDGTGVILIRKRGDVADAGCVRIYNVKRFRDACRVLAERLPRRVVEEAGGLGEVLAGTDEDDGSVR